MHEISRSALGILPRAEAFRVSGIGAQRDEEASSWRRKEEGLPFSGEALSD